MFDRCPHLWYQSYVLRIPRPPVPQMQYGIDVHNLASLMWADAAPEGMTEAMLRKALEMEFYYMPDPNEARALALRLCVEARRLMDREKIHYSPTGSAVNDTAGILGTEKRVIKNSFIGYVDLLAKDADDALHVIDWKTTSYEYNDFEVRTSEQLTAYQWLVEQKFNVVPDYLSFVTLNKRTGTATMYRTPAREVRLVKAFAEKVDEVREQMEAQVQRRNPNGCVTRFGTREYYCQFYNDCWSDGIVRVSIDHLPRFNGQDRRHREYLMWHPSIERGE